MPSSFKIILFVTLVITACGLFAFRDVKPAQAIRNTLVLQAESFARSVVSLQSIPIDKQHSRQLQIAFVQTRLAYKKLEWATEYFDPLTSRKVNGPPVPESELSGQVILPEGLQVIEQLIYPTASSKKQLKLLLAALAVNAGEFKSFFNHFELEDWQILDAVKLEVFRVETLGLNRFDDPLSGQCFRESAVALASLQRIMVQYPKHEQLDRRFKSAIHYLNSPVKFNTFNRADFLIKYANPLTKAITSFTRQLALPDFRYNRLLKQEAETLFSPNAFNRNAYTAVPDDSATTEKTALGKVLFFDKRLSGTNTRSCASCHQPDKAFTDGLAKNFDLTGKKAIARNTPTLINAALQAAQFDDLRVSSLEDQVTDVLRDRAEMHGDMRISTKVLWNDTLYRKLFTNAFKIKDRTMIDTAEVMNALASYVRSLTALNSRFDQFMQGNSHAITSNEIAGFNIFMGKARCSTCHYLPLFNGTLPPRYMQIDAEVIGVPKTTNSKFVDPDLGYYNIMPYNFNRHAFKTTTVRNAAQTAPYMHNGAFTSLEDVIGFYDKGGASGLGIILNNQTLDVKPLHLTPKEKQDLVAFIKALNSK